MAFSTGYKGAARAPTMVIDSGAAYSAIRLRAQSGAQRDARISVEDYDFGDPPIGDPDDIDTVIDIGFDAGPGGAMANDDPDARRWQLQLERRFNDLCEVLLQYHNPQTLEDRRPLYITVNRTTDAPHIYWVGTSHWLSDDGATELASMNASSSVFSLLQDAGYVDLGFGGSIVGRAAHLGPLKVMLTIDGDNHHIVGTSAERVALAAPMQAKAYDVATKPNANTFAGCIIEVSDGNAGAPCYAIAVGGSWLRLVTGAAVATS